MGFLRRQAVTAALVANAIRPAPGYVPQVPAFFASWLTGELAPHALAATVADAAVHATPSRRDRRALALAGLNIAGLVYLVSLARRVQHHAEDSLTEGLGVDYGEQLDRRPSPAELATPWRSLVNPFRNRADGVRIERDIAYNDHGKRGRLDLYLPDDDPEKAPVLLQVHGGAWTIGTKDQQGLPLMRHLAAKGWICVAINYRLAPRDRWPAQIVDVKQAIAWIREHIGSYGGDPDYIAITGGSAGGHLCSLAALTPNDPAWQPGFEDADTSVQACVPHYGVYDLTGTVGGRKASLMRDRFLARYVFPARYDDDPSAYEEASPLTRVTAEAPDFFVLHGAHDSLVPVAQARELVSRLRSTSDATVVYAELPGAQHAFDVFPSIRSAHVVRAIDRFLHWHWGRYRSLPSSRGSEQWSSSAGGD
jgi:acetyl esterase/lipase